MWKMTNLRELIFCKKTTLSKRPLNWMKKILKKTSWKKGIILKKTSWVKGCCIGWGNVEKDKLDEDFNEGRSTDAIKDFNEGGTTDIVDVGLDCKI